MKISKNIFIILIILVIIIIAANIMFTKQDVNINIQELANQLSNAPIFEDSLSQIDRDVIIKEYDLDNEKIKNIISYEGTGATSEKILIIELVDKKDINEIKKKLETKIEERKIDFENYLSKEVFKLDNYNLENRENYVILCVSNDCDKAKEIINQYIK